MIKPGAPSTADVPLLPLRDLERAGILRALLEANRDRQRTASLLGITPSALDRKLADHGIGDR